LKSAALEQDDRFFFGGFVSLLQKFAALAHAFHVHEDRAGVRVLPEKFQVLVKADVGLVAHAHVVGEPLAALQFGLGDQGQGHVAALGQQGDVAFGRVLEAHQVEVVLEVDHARSVGADQADLISAGTSST
jgi:hypothetical protein